MYTAIKGVYENGKVKFLEPVPDIKGKSEILITFLNPNEQEEVKKRIPGGLLQLDYLKDVKLSIPDDFNDALSDFKDYM
ncbi:MAG: hypothetical protein KKE39_07765 [Bacteroidetes bacterium]|nr:hypothetical protein [Bacteroidota bacterium]MBU1373564.1 hypothetical protein [Bacteroidota bacterium]MBU1484396.1 hypothetical protein [Bacteroidota bacterium]MBU1760578.1 hypothetical protein [Bacteroidota bacterium]MBU2046145.1 hypothetical protein [Bacteroidota bacterium]